MKTKSLAIAILLTTVAAILTVINHYVGSIPHPVLFAARWFAVNGIVLYAVYKRSLPTWILVSMIVGAVIGHDFPVVAQDGHINARVLSLIFLRMIKTIIAPLIFAT